MNSYQDRRTKRGGDKDGDGNRSKDRRREGLRITVALYITLPLLYFSHFIHLIKKFLSILLIIISTVFTQSKDSGKRIKSSFHADENIVVEAFKVSSRFIFYLRLSSFCLFHL